MKKLGAVLSGLLVLQCLASVGLELNTKFGKAEFQSKPLLAADTATVTKLELSSDANDISVVKGAHGWVLPGLGELPADSKKVNTALNELVDLKTSWPVTTTAASLERFEVADSKFRRRIRLYSADKLDNEFFVGTSPGFKKSHVRLAGDNNVYEMPLNTYDFPVNNGDWLDKSLLDASDIRAVKGPDYELAKVDKQWSLDATEGDGAAPKLITEKAKELTQALASFKVREVVEPAPDFSSPEVVWLDVTGEQTWHYQFLQKDKKYYVKRNDRETVFTLSATDYQRLAGVARKDLQEPQTKADKP